MIADEQKDRPQKHADTSIIFLSVLFCLLTTLLLSPLASLNAAEVRILPVAGVPQILVDGSPVRARLFGERLEPCRSLCPVRS